MFNNLIENAAQNNTTGILRVKDDEYIPFCQLDFPSIHLNRDSDEIDSDDFLELQHLTFKNHNISKATIEWWINHIPDKQLFIPNSYYHGYESNMLTPYQFLKKRVFGVIPSYVFISSVNQVYAFPFMLLQSISNSVNNTKFKFLFSLMVRKDKVKEIKLKWLLGLKIPTHYFQLWVSEGFDTKNTCSKPLRKWYRTHVKTAIQEKGIQIIEKELEFWKLHIPININEYYIRLDEIKYNFINQLREQEALPF
jgi:hypothetical protein